MTSELTGGVLAAALVAAGANAAEATPARRASSVVALTPAQRFLARNRAADHAVRQTPSGLQYKVLAAGTGTARPGDRDVALVTYVGRLASGQEFDRADQPTELPVGGVVPGFAEALRLMPRGSRYRFWLPPALAYGDTVTGPIPARSVLMFDVQLIDFHIDPGADAPSSDGSAAPR